LNPKGVDISVGTMWVANFDDGTVSVYKYDGDVDSKYYFYQNITLPEGAKPYEVFYNNKKSTLYVTDVGLNEIHVLYEATVIRSISVGSDPWGITANSMYAYCANSYDKNVSRVNLLDWTVTNFTIDKVVASIATDKNNNVYISTLDDSYIYKYDQDLNFLAKYDTFNNNTWIDSNLESESVYVAHLFADYPKPIELDTYAKFDDFEEVLNVEPSTEVVSNEVVVENLLRPEVFSIEGYSGAKFIVNGVAKADGSSVTLENGDTLALSIYSSSVYYESIYLNISAKGYSKDWHIKTKPKLFPDKIQFKTRYNVVPGEEFVTNELEIKGITEGFTSTITASEPAAIIIVNGERVGNTAVVRKYW
jgi:hypothetical protein